jgi:hypothetical protein
MDNRPATQTKNIPTTVAEILATNSGRNVAMLILQPKKNAETVSSSAKCIFKNWCPPVK